MSNVCTNCGLWFFLSWNLMFASANQWKLTSIVIFRPLGSLINCVSVIFLFYLPEISKNPHCFITLNLKSNIRWAKIEAIALHLWFTHAIETWQPALEKLFILVIYLDKFPNKFSVRSSAFLDMLMIQILTLSSIFSLHGCYMCKKKTCTFLPHQLHINGILEIKVI